MINYFIIMHHISNYVIIIQHISNFLITTQHLIAATRIRYLLYEYYQNNYLSFVEFSPLNLLQHSTINISLFLTLNTLLLGEINVR